MDRWRDGVARRRRMSLDMKSRHWKVSHAPTRVNAWTVSYRRGAARGELFAGGVSFDVLIDLVRLRI